MRPEGWRAFGGGGGTSLHAAALALLIVGALLIWLVPRRHIIKPFLALAILIPLEQQVVVAGVHFTALRITILCAWLRLSAGILGGRRFLPGDRTAIDVVLVLWALWGVLAYTVTWGDVAAAVPKLGFLFNALGAYFLFRHLLRDRADVDRMIRTLAVICVVLASLMSIEQATGRNLLSVFGASPYPEVRLGRIRSQVSFLHSITAGTFGAFLLPVFIGLWWSRRSRHYAAAGACSAAVMVLASSSSTPVGAVVAGAAALCMWPLRGHMRLLRWGTLATAVALHIAMEAPVWALLGRIRLVGGSTSWHRFTLVDQCIRQVGDWWLVGTMNNDTWGFDMWDTANWYVSSAVHAGLIGLALFVALISLSFRAAGIARLGNARDESNERFVWGLGAALFASAISFLGIELFDQSIIGWYALLALIAASPTLLRSRKAQRTTDDGNLGHLHI